jgi:hypothetical protein
MFLFVVPFKTLKNIRVYSNQQRNAGSSSSLTYSYTYVIIGNLLKLYLLFIMKWDWVQFVLRPLFGLLCQSQMIYDDDDCGAIGGMWIGRRNRRTLRKPAPVPLCPPQIPHDMNQSQIRDAAVVSQRLTAELWHGPNFNILSAFISQWETQDTFTQDFSKVAHSRYDMS